MKRIEEVQYVYNITDRSGTIGLQAPNNELESKLNLVCQLYNDKKIDVPMFSIFLKDNKEVDKAQLTSLKPYLNQLILGGYDLNGFKNK